jgi:hypothetical protein
MNYASPTAGIEHYPDGEFDAFGKDGKRIPETKAVTIRRRAVREREAKRPARATRGRRAR